MPITEAPIKNRTLWRGVPPTHCDLCCGFLGGEVFIDGKTQMGPWAKLCFVCWIDHGVGCGTGKGQIYEKIGSNVWAKVTG